MGLKVGDELPDFSLKDQDGNLFSSADLKGKKSMVIYFYPKDETAGCTKEACSFRDSYEDFKALGAEVIGISSDTEKSHRRFAKRHRLPFILLADTEKKVRKLFRVKNNLFLLPGRETYVIDESGKVGIVFNSVNPTPHIKRALKFLKKGKP